MSGLCRRRSRRRRPRRRRGLAPDETALDRHRRPWAGDPMAERHHSAHPLRRRSLPSFADADPVREAIGSPAQGRW